MTFIEAILAALGLNKASLFTGAVGAGVAALSGDSKTLLQRVLNFTVGFFVAAWGAGLVIAWFKLPETGTFYGSLGFVLGYLGMSIMDALTAAAAALKTVDFKALITGFFGRGAK